MIQLDDIKAQWADDSRIDNDLLDNESTKIPQLHSKYLNYLSDVRCLKIRKEQEYKQKRIMLALKNNYTCLEVAREVRIIFAAGFVPAVTWARPLVPFAPSIRVER